jgi:hypothetical protein
MLLVDTIKTHAGFYQGLLDWWLFQSNWGKNAISMIDTFLTGVMAFLGRVVVRATTPNADQLGQNIAHGIMTFYLTF